MVLPTTATLDTFVNPYGDTAVHLAADIDPAFYPVSDVDLIRLSVSVTSDAVSVPIASARRRTVLNLQQPPMQPTTSNAPVDKFGKKIACQVSIWSSSPNDTSAGTGLRTGTLHYKDSTGATNTLAVTMNGTTPVTTNDPSLDINEILPTSTFDTFGSSETNQGVIYIQLLPKNGLAPVFAASFEEGFLVKYAASSTWVDPFKYLMRNALQKAVGPVVTVLPVLT
jgi:hypothetical protein